MVNRLDMLMKEETEAKNIKHRKDSSYWTCSTNSCSSTKFFFRLYSSTNLVTTFPET